MFESHQILFLSGKSISEGRIDSYYEFGATIDASESAIKVADDQIAKRIPSRISNVLPPWPD